jgi:predicted molibdopterin-dependent oxidoreductase YjgC
MTEEIQLRVNGRAVNVRAGTVVAAAIARAGALPFRASVRGDPRGPLCGMGVCMECRVTINGVRYCRSCLVLCETGMEIQTDVPEQTSPSASSRKSAGDGHAR